MRNICTEAGMLALRAGHDYVVPNDFIKVCKFLLIIYITLLQCFLLMNYDHNLNVFSGCNETRRSEET